MHRQKLTIAITGALVLAVSAGLFFLLVSAPEETDWWAVSFIWFAEFFAAAGLIFFSRLSRYHGLRLFAGALSVFAIYAFLAIAASLVSVLWLRGNFRALISLQVVLFGLTLIALFLLVSVSGKLSRNNTAALDSVLAMEGLAARLLVLAHNPANEKFAKDIEDAYELVRYSDHSVTVDADALIGREISGLEELLARNAGEAPAREKLGAIAALVETRRQEARRVKTGKI